MLFARKSSDRPHAHSVVRTVVPLVVHNDLLEGHEAATLGVLRAVDRAVGPLADPVQLFVPLDGDTATECGVSTGARSGGGGGGGGRG